MIHTYGKVSSLLPSLIIAYYHNTIHGVVLPVTNRVLCQKYWDRTAGTIIGLFSLIGQGVDIGGYPIFAELSLLYNWFRPLPEKYWS